MKTRSPFVSNSSSCSFVLFGAVFSVEELEKCLEAVDPKLFASYVQEVGEYGYHSAYEMRNAICNLAEKRALGKSKLTCEIGLEEYGDDSLAIGLQFHDMNLDETKAEFLARCEAMLNELLGRNDVKAGIVSDQGYNG